MTSESPRRGRTSAKQSPPAFGALDLGTSNCRLLIAEPAARGFRVIDGFSRVVRLGEGMERTGELGEPAIARTIAALRVCADKLRLRRVVAQRGVATEACRRARNGPEFLARVAAETGLALDPITTAEEAALVLAGCAELLGRAPARVLVFDIGGGSTELILAEVNGSGRPAVLASTSIPCGVVTLADRYAADRYAPALYRSVIEEVARLVRPFEDAQQLGPGCAKGEIRLIGTSGTVTTLTAMHLGLPRYDRARVDGQSLPVAAARAQCARIAAMSLAERRAEPCIGPERADLVVVGCAILEAICGQWQAAELTVADRGIREGILLDLMRARDAAPAH